ncbi:MAG: hypothetical protein IPJ20_14680 [Flammeovirgaceae bacterium]|nr:hypothetical protein [Flammeovirgaceae bacterium]
MLILWQAGYSQNHSIDVTNASDPATMISKITTDFESYIFVGDARYYAIRLGYDYGLANGKHLVGMSIPFVHTIFIGDYGGYENTTGIGDLKMRYMYVPIQKNLWEDCNGFLLILKLRLQRANMSRAKGQERGCINQESF